jgi:membrane protein DedA with SNARE-associated domain
MSWVQAFLDWVAANPGLSLAAIFGVALGDSLFLIGFIFPSYIILFGVGALVALDVLPLWPALLAATAGAMAGDGLNYWLGRVYLERWMHHPRMARYRENIESARRFLEHRGGAGLILGRLIGVTRPVVPIVAGAAKMSPLHFAFWATLSCFIWAVVYMIPGAAVGASLSLAAEVATRLAIMLLGAIALVMVLVWLTRLIGRASALYAESLLFGLLDWSQRHRRLGRVPRWLADPDQPEMPALLVLATILLIGGWIWLLLFWGMDRTTPLAFDALVYRSLAELHTPWGLTAANWIAHLGDAPVMVAVGAATVITLFGLRRFRAVGHSIAALAFGGVIALGLSLGVRVPDPVDFYDPTRDGSYSGADLIFTTMVIGLIPILLATRKRPKDTTRYYTWSVALLGLLTAAQLYLGRQWFSIAAGSIVIGALWMLVLGIGYRRHGAQLISSKLFLIPVLMTFAVTVVMVPPAKLAPQHQPPVVDVMADRWWDEHYRRLPVHRGDGTGRARQPLGLQWNTSRESLLEALEADGWQLAQAFNWQTSLRYLAPSSPLTELPIPPQLLLMSEPLTVRFRPLGDDRLEVLRLWRSNLRTEDGPIWVGSLTWVETRRPLGIMQLPRTLSDYTAPLNNFTPPASFEARRVRHPGQAETADGWDGRVWLLRSAP